LLYYLIDIKTLAKIRHNSISKKELLKMKKEIAIMLVGILLLVTSCSTAKDTKATLTTNTKPSKSQETTSNLTTSAEIDAENKKVLDNIKPVESSTPTAGTTSTSNTTSEPTALDKAKEAVGSRLSELQNDLQKLGYRVDTIGTFGQVTYDSLVKFQSEHGLTADGLAGSATFSKINALTNPKPSTSSNTSSNNSSTSSSTSSNNSSTTTATVNHLYTPSKPNLVNADLTAQFMTVFRQAHPNSYNGVKTSLLHQIAVGAANGELDLSYLEQYFRKIGTWTEYIGTLNGVTYNRNCTLSCSSSSCVGGTSYFKTSDAVSIWKEFTTYPGAGVTGSYTDAVEAVVTNNGPAPYEIVVVGININVK
jgi:peptidoglycan hydrolase-like protein with peptidoglycan-binding domain